VTDHAEREVRKWALKRNGDPIQNEDIVSLVFAFADDQDADHNQTMRLLDVAKQERQVLCHKVSDLELWQHDTQTTCAERVKKLISEEHEDRHGKHMEQHHNSDASFQQKFIWWWGSKVSYIVVAVLIVVLNIAINMIWFGRP